MRYYIIKITTSSAVHFMNLYAYNIQEAYDMVRECYEVGRIEIL